jgi:hypothetical protein
MKAIKRFVMAFIEVVQDTKKLRTEEMKKRYFQR